MSELHCVDQRLADRGAELSPPNHPEEKMLGFFLRFVMALILVMATWNPSGYSYFHWLLQTLPQITAPLALAGVVLLIGWIIYLHATLESLGLVGIALTGALLGTLAWVVLDQGWLPLHSEGLMYLVLVLVALVLAIGLYWSILWHRLSGQVEVEDHHR